MNELSLTDAQLDMLSMLVGEAMPDIVAVETQSLSSELRQLAGNPSTTTTDVQELVSNYQGRLQTLESLELLFGIKIEVPEGG